MKFDAPVVGNHEARERAQKRLNALREVVFFGWGIVFDMAIWGRFPTFWLLKIFKIKDTLQNKITFGDIV